MDIALIAVFDVLLLAFLIYGSLRIYKALKKRDCIIRELRQDLGALCTGASGVSGHLGRLDQQVRRLVERQDKVEVGDPANRAYHQAIRLIRNGADIGEVMDTCGLVRTEAELLIMLHRGDKGNPKIFHNAA